MPTFARRLAPRRRRHIYLTTIALPALLLILALSAYVTHGNGTDASYPNLSQNAAGVTCANAQVVADAFGNAVAGATQATPDYTGVQAFGFTPPLNPTQINTFLSLLSARLSQVQQKAQAVSNGICTDNPTARVTTANGQVVTLPVVYGQQPGQPISGAQSNADSRTIPVTIGTRGNNQRTSTWSELADLYGNATWYTTCANTNLAMNWHTDVPKFIATEGAGHDDRFILAVNTTLTDSQIRTKAAADGNPNVGKLPIVRTPSIVNTRDLANHRCDRFVDARSMIRVSLGKVIFDQHGKLKALELDKGIFVDCHNQWFLPKTPPAPTTPTPTPTSTHPGTTPPGTPTTTPPTTKPPACKNGGVPPKCLQPKDPKSGAGSKGNVPTPVQGTNPPVTSSPQPRPSSPATGTACPPSIPSC